ncbi:hypothetical protein E4K67_06835 [Desulfosporosinus fructosivorans]|uniref:Glycosyltransferase RgtA/B/C/D-like domain-containing protein n=1 Tax=Desulfosporosinus fructosivorans TaxID=2018669 RepID=A0A4Z0R8G5_9FIRM|nr:hypothetical protein E4K67_06835 [Desulfosporosinus fructosivorans]
MLLVRTEPVSDFKYYHRIATQIANGGQWGDTYTTVGYPIFLAPFYWCFGASIWVAKALNLVLSTINNLLVLHILEKTGIRETLRQRTFVLYVLFPMNIYYNSMLASEILFTTLFLLGTYLYLTDINYKYVYIGLITGLNTMVKPYFPLFALAIILTDFLGHEKLWKSMKNGVVVLLVTGVIIAPWLYRNYKLIGEFTYVSNNAGIVLYINNNTQNKLSGWMLAEDVENSVVNRPDYNLANSTQKNIMLSRDAREWIMGHPREFVCLGLKRLSKTFIQAGDIDYAFQGSGLLPFLQVIMFRFSEFVRMPVFLGGVASIVIHTLLYSYLTVGNRLTKRSARFVLNFDGGKGRLFLIITFLMFAGVYFITEGQSRYAFPTVLSLCVYAVMGIEGVKKLRG